MSEEGVRRRVDVIEGELDADTDEPGEWGQRGGALGYWGIGELGHCWGIIGTFGHLGIGALGHWGIGALGHGGIGAWGIGAWGIGALGHWGIGALGSWGIGELGR